MEKQKIEIGTLPVTIRVVEVGGKRMTKAVFNQIPESEFIDTSDTFEPHEGTHYLGWVKVGDEKAIIFTYDNVLYKYTYSRATPEKQVVSEYSRSKRHKDSNNEMLKNIYIQAKKEYDRDYELCQQWNCAFENYLLDSQQLYIAI